MRVRVRVRVRISHSSLIILAVPGGGHHGAGMDACSEKGVHCGGYPLVKGEGERAPATADGSNPTIATILVHELEWPAARHTTFLPNRGDSSL